MWPREANTQFKSASCADCANAIPVARTRTTSTDRQKAVTILTERPLTERPFRTARMLVRRATPRRGTSSLAAKLGLALREKCPVAGAEVLGPEAREALVEAAAARTFCTLRTRSHARLISPVLREQ